MNETAFLLYAILAFAIGYGVAHFAKNIGRFFEEWGFFSFFLFPLIVVLLIAGAGMIAESGNLALSLFFAIGFLVRMVRRGR